jgi:hypothetical protein
MRLRKQGERDTLAELDKFQEMRQEAQDRGRRRLEEMGLPPVAPTSTPTTKELGLQERPRQEGAQREEMMKVSDGPRMAEPEKMAPPADGEEDVDVVAMEGRSRRKKIRKEVIPGMRAAWFRNWEELHAPVFSRQFGQVHVDWVTVADLIRTGGGLGVNDEGQLIGVRFLDEQGTIELSGPYGHENDPGIELPVISGVVVEDVGRREGASETPMARDTLVTREFITFHLTNGHEPASLAEAERITLMFEDVRLPGAAPQAVETLRTALNRMRVARRGGVVGVARETRSSPPLEQVQLPELEDPAVVWESLSELHRRTVIEEVTRSKADGVRGWRERWDRFLQAFQVRLLQSRHFDAHRRGENPRPRVDIVREEEMRRSWNELSDEERSDLIRRAAPRAFSSNEVFAALGSWDALKAVAGLDSVERRIFEVVISRLERNGTIIVEGGTEPEEPERFDVYDRARDQGRY